MASTYGLYVYGLVNKLPAQLDIEGIDRQHKVYPLAAKDFSIMVSTIEIDEFQSQLRELAEAATTGKIAESQAQVMLLIHEKVLDILMQDTTVVPFKFGTILKDEQVTIKMLQENEERFKNLLAKFAGKVEWGLKVYADQQEFMRCMAQREPEVNSPQRPKLGRGAAYLMAKKMEADLKDDTVARLAALTERIFRELGSEAYEAKLNETMSKNLTGKKGEMVLNSVYLVERMNEDEFYKKGKNLIKEYESMALEIELSGPWPPYSFTG
jgi:hypothetical protein